ncbi:MAG: HTH domain-containing protein [Pseudomonadota bacterium]
MRAARLLRILLLLQNRGRQTSRQLAEDLEVAPRTILRDLDAMTEAGLPIVAHRGQGGGIELGFNYRTRLTGLAADEAEALAYVLGRPLPELAELRMAEAAARARTKLIESMPDRVRSRMHEAAAQFRAEIPRTTDPDPRIAAMAEAVRDQRIVRIRSRSRTPRTVHPTALLYDGAGWCLVDGLSPECPVPSTDWDDINISSRRFVAAATLSPTRHGPPD